MQLNFTKMSGAGNDFILLDNRAHQVALTEAQIVKLCDRHKGIGADGVMLLVPSSSGKADWAWQFYNSDGSGAAMCGNGARCFARYIQRVAGANGSTSFETLAGVIHATFNGELVTVNLTPPHSLQLDQKIDLKHGTETVHSIIVGNPHAVIFVDDADKAMVSSVGHEVRFHKHFTPKGTNVNFVQLLGKNHIRVRTYERGVEGETLACGTGATSSALISATIHSFQSPVRIQVQSGDQLEVSFQKTGNEFEDVRLTGPAEFVFEGQINI